MALAAAASTRGVAAHRGLLVGVGGGGKYSDIDIAFDTLLGMRRMCLLKALRDDVFPHKLGGVDLGDCTVLVRAHADVKWSSAVDAGPAFELEGLETLAGLLAAAPGGALAAGTLFIHVQLPASAAAGAGEWLRSTRYVHRGTCASMRLAHSRHWRQRAGLCFIDHALMLSTPTSLSLDACRRGGGDDGGSGEWCWR